MGLLAHISQKKPTVAADGGPEDHAPPTQVFLVPRGTEPSLQAAPAPSQKYTSLANPRYGYAPETTHQTRPPASIPQVIDPRLCSLPTSFPHQRQDQHPASLAAGPPKGHVAPASARHDGSSPSESSDESADDHGSNDDENEDTESNNGSDSGDFHVNSADKNNRYDNNTEHYTPGVDYGDDAPNIDYYNHPQGFYFPPFIQG